jgi:hypothetical protein
MTSPPLLRKLVDAILNSNAACSPQESQKDS